MSIRLVVTITAAPGKGAELAQLPRFLKRSADISGGCVGIE